MKESLLKDFRSEYKKRLKEKIELDKDLEILIKRRRILENSPIVKDYIELNNKIEEAMDKVCSEEDIFLSTLYEFDSKGLATDTNNILLYMGTFINENGYARLVDRNSSIAEFDRFINIESLDDVDVPVEDRDVFERNNNIIFLDNKEPSMYLLHEIRDKFIQSALTDGQEKACKKILSRNKKN